MFKTRNYLGSELRCSQLFLRTFDLGVQKYTLFLNYNDIFSFILRLFSTSLKNS